MEFGEGCKVGVVEKLLRCLVHELEIERKRVAIGIMSCEGRLEESNVVVVGA